jgi:carbon-monoxide dehydrogenase small subunit
MTTSYRLHVNGVDQPVEGAWEGESLLYVLRERLGLPGAKGACEQGECGSCSVMLDGDVVCSCLVLAAAATGREVTTVEAVVTASPIDGAIGLSDVQQAFLDAGAVQCGFCTPGLVVAVHDLLDRQPDADDLTIREALAGNLCRCTGYGRILEAVRLTADRRSETARTGSTRTGA